MLCSQTASHLDWQTNLAFEINLLRHHPSCTFIVLTWRRSLTFVMERYKIKKPFFGSNGVRVMAKCCLHPNLPTVLGMMMDFRSSVWPGSRQCFFCLFFVQCFCQTPLATFFIELICKFWQTFLIIIQIDVFIKMFREEKTLGTTNFLVIVIIVIFFLNLSEIFARNLGEICKNLVIKFSGRLRHLIRYFSNFY